MSKKRLRKRLSPLYSLYSIFSSASSLVTNMVIGSLTLIAVIAVGERGNGVHKSLPAVLIAFGLVSVFAAALCSVVCRESAHRKAFARGILVAYALLLVAVYALRLLPSVAMTGVAFASWAAGWMLISVFDPEGRQRRGRRVAATGLLLTALPMIFTVGWLIPGSIIGPLLWMWGMLMMRETR
jgi:hypothetical protein